MSNQLIQDLNQIMEQKLDLFKDIYNITAAQQKDIEDNDAGNIEALVQQKQQYIDKIDLLDERFMTGYNKLKEEMKLGSLDSIDISKYPEMKSIKTNVEKIMALASRVMEFENSNREKLDVIFQRVKGELKQLNTGKRSLKAYEAAPVHNGGIYIDKKK